jgi:hypothetical protein
MKPIKCNLKMIGIALITFQTCAFADHTVSFTANVADRSVEAAYEMGDVVPVTFYIYSQGTAGIVGMEFELAALSDDVLIHDITFAPAFSEVMGRPEPVFPVSRFKTVRVQALADFDPILGAQGAPVPFATVELEMLTDRSIPSALSITARGTLTDGAAERTTVIDPATTQYDGRAGRNTLGVINLGEAAAGGELGGTGALGGAGAVDGGGLLGGGAGAFGEMTSLAAPHGQIADVSLELREVGGEAVVGALVSGREYEVHYHTEVPQVNDYGLYVMTAPGGQGISVATQTADGPWAATEYFSFQDASAEPIELAAVLYYPAGYVNTQFIWSMFPPAAEGEGGGADAVTGGPAGHLCNIIPAAPGDIILTLSMAWFGDATPELVTMESRAAFTVE